MKHLPQQHVVVVGAGMAGLSAAGMLSGRGFAVTVLDKARGVGGRMATRRLGDAVADHGAQYFTARDGRFSNLMQGFLGSGVIGSWSIPVADGAYIGLRGMTAVPKALAAGIDVRLGERVVSIGKRERHWRICTEPGTVLEADAVILTAPVPQSLAMLSAGDVVLEPEEQGLLESIEYEPCFVAIAVLDGPSGVPEPGWVELAGDPLAVIADNRQKGISPGKTAITVQAGPEFSRAHLYRDKGEVGRLLLAEAAPWLRAGITEVSLQRWLYSRPVGRREHRCLALSGDLPLVLAGDAFGGPRVEGAWLSGLAAARELIELKPGPSPVLKGVER